MSSVTTLASAGPVISLRMAVFDSEEFPQQFIDYFVHDENTELKHKTTHIKESAYKLTLTKDNSINGTPFVQAQGKLLDRFVTFLENRVDEKLPQFSLTIEKEYFVLENHQSLTNCLRHYGARLVQLQMTLPSFSTSFPGLLPNVQLSNLQKITVTFVGNDQPFTRQNAVCANQLHFLQFILMSATFLKEFTIPKVLGYPPPHFQYLNFPESLTTLVLRCQLRNTDLELLAGHKFPNLSTLMFTLENTAYSDGILSRIMNNVADTLKILRIRKAVRCYPGSPKPVNLVCFPKMKELERLIILSSGVELNNKQSYLTKCFPKLRSLYLTGQTQEMLQKWIDSANNPVNSVKSLALQMVDPSQPETSAGYTLPLNEEIMQEVHLAFPNVTSLCLQLDVLGLKYLFREMRQLGNLQLEITGTGSAESTDQWDSILTGVPVDIIQAVKKNPDFLDDIVLNDSVPSIKHLKALCSLELDVIPKTSKNGVASPLISDFTFAFALLKMPELGTVKLGKRFMASELMIHKWKEQGRQIFLKDTGSSKTLEEL